MSVFGNLYGSDDDRGGFGGSRFRTPYRQPLPAPEAASVGKQILDTGLSGLGYIGSSLNKVGRAVRGPLAGRPREALNVIPFSDTLGITDPTQEVTGRDLTNKAGLTRRGDKGWGAWGAGLAAELGTDPLTYLSLGTKAALTAPGIAARAAGTLAPLSRAERVAQGLAGHIGVGLPFRDPSLVLGTGKVGQGVAGLADRAADFAMYKVPGAKALSAAFGNVGGAVDEVTQRAWRKYGAPALAAGQATARADRFKLLSQLDPLITAGAHPERAITGAVRQAAEGASPRNVPPALAAQVQGLGTQLGDLGRRQLGEARPLGVPLEDVADPFVGYVPRHALGATPGAPQYRERGSLNPVVSGSNIHRQNPYRAVPGGTEAINRFAVDPRLSGKSRTLADADVEAVLKREFVAELTATGKPLTPELDAHFDDKATQLASALKGLGEHHATDKLPLFTPDIVGDVTTRGAQHAKTIASGHAIQGLLADAAKPFGPGMVPLPVALKQLGLRTWKADQNTGQPIEGAMAHLYGRLAGQHGLAPVDLMGRRKALSKELATLGIPQEQLDQATKQYGRWVAPEVIKAPLKGVDTANNLFKNLAYQVWIPSHIRNAVSALVTNTLEGIPLSAYAKQFKAMTGRGGADLGRIPGMPAGLNPAQQAEWVRGLGYAHGNLYSGANQAGDLVGVAQALTNPLGPTRFTPEVPGSGRAGPTGNLVGDVANLLREGAFGTKDTSPFKILGQKGVGGRTADTWSPLAAGRIAGQTIEDFFRGANLLGNVERGFTPAAAAERMQQLHINYDTLTDFEKKVMRRVFPFYTFMRRNLPLQVGEAFAHPVRAQVQLRPMAQGQGDRYTPGYLKSGVALPIGQEHPEGPDQVATQRYISSLGLPLEEAFERMHFKGGLPDVKRTILHYMGGTNPILKGIAEQIFDTQFYSGRKLSDLRPTAVSRLGGLLSDENARPLAQLLANTPATRFVSAFDKLIDPRKGVVPKALNLLTGVKVTDVDVDKQRAIETRDAVQELLAGAPHVKQFPAFYVPKQDQAKLTPEELQRMRLLTTLEAAAREHAARERLKPKPGG